MESAASRKPSHVVINTCIFSIVVFWGCLGYISLVRGQFDLRSINDASAVCAMILVGLSFALSGICYFWNFADSKIIYRKDLGLVGFAFVVAHSIISLFFLPDIFPFPTYYIQSTTIVPFIYAVEALAIYAFMTAISNTYAIRRIGGATWRMLLRFGYVAYFASLLHFGLKGYQFWWHYLTGHGRSWLPSEGLLVFVFGLFVIGLRIAVFIATSKPKAQPLPAPATPTAEPTTGESPATPTGT